MFSLASTAVKTVLQVNKPTGKPPGFLWVRAAQSSHEPHGEKGAYTVTTTLGDHAQINVEGVFEPIDDLNTVRDEGLGKFLVTEAGSGPVSMNLNGETNTLRNPSRKGPWNPQFPVASGRMNRSKRYLDGEQRERERIIPEEAFVELPPPLQSEERYYWVNGERRDTSGPCR